MTADRWRQIEDLCVTPRWNDPSVSARRFCGTACAGDGVLRA